MEKEIATVFDIKEMSKVIGVRIDVIKECLGLPIEPEVEVKEVQQLPEEDKFPSIKTVEEAEKEFQRIKSVEGKTSPNLKEIFKKGRTLIKEEFNLMDSLEKTIDLYEKYSSFYFFYPMYTFHERAAQVVASFEEAEKVYVITFSDDFVRAVNKTLFDHSNMVETILWKMLEYATSVSHTEIVYNYCNKSVTHYRTKVSCLTKWLTFVSTVKEARKVYEKCAQKTKPVPEVKELAAEKWESLLMKEVSRAITRRTLTKVVESSAPENSEAKRIAIENLDKLLINEIRTAKNLKDTLGVFYDIPRSLNDAEAKKIGIKKLATFFGYE
ncbi:MAG: hypothetical protein WC795_02010 [Candidatus Paceibacterota bacterium]|jgi:hypothetical protein